jgi:C-terminal processing protease CtpA/Prc/outer membrane protein OmpA-like peptidoglycan-associated protein
MSKISNWSSLRVRLFFPLSLFVFIFGHSFGQVSPTENIKYLEPGYYSVVGVFKYEENAAKFSDQMDRRGEESEYAFYPPRGYYYVQIGKYDSFQKARIKVLKTRAKANLDSTWVYKALPFKLQSGEVIGGDVKMDVGIGLQYEIERDTANITEVYPGGTSDVAGIKIRDQIISVDDSNVAGVELTDSEVEELLHGKEGSEVNIAVMRDGEIIEYNITREDFEATETNPGIKLESKNNTSDPKNYLGMDYAMYGDTLFVTGIDPGGKADILGLQVGDKLLEFGDEIVTGKNKSYEAVTEAISEAIEKGSIVTVIRDGELYEYNLSPEELLDPKIMLGMDYELRNDTLYITRVDKGSKADEAGLKRGDKLVEFGNEDMTGSNISENDISNFMAIAVTEGVMVTVLRDGIEHDFLIRPDNYDVSNSAGIGIIFDIRQDTAFVKRVIEGSSSEALGLLPGDKILKIGNDVVTGSSANSKGISNKLTGTEGTSTNLTILRHNEVMEYTLKRDVLMAGAHIDRLDGGKFSGIKGRAVEKDLKGKKFYLNTVRANSYAEVSGMVEVVDPDKVQRFAYKNAHEIIGIPESINRSGNISLICEIFGFKKIQHDLNLNEPFTERTERFLSMDDSVLVVTFELLRLTKGDLVTMYNVYFFKDAAMMRPESEYEVQQLLYMLKENPDYKISIQGHTNGNNSGPIIEMEEGSTAYFSHEGATKEGFGSAKKLSQARADLIRDYLVENGIDSNRMEATGYGGKKAIYKKLDKLAYKNVRVEIQILAD